MRTQAICLALAIVLLCSVASAQWVKVANCDTTQPNAFAIVVRGTEMFAAAANGVYLSTNNGESWKFVNSSPQHVMSFFYSDTNVFAGTSDDGIYLSRNNGTSWTAVNEGLPRRTYDTTQYYDIRCLVGSGSNLFAGGGGGVFLSTDNGTGWTVANSGLTNTMVACLAVGGTSLFAGTGEGVFRSTNNGTSWTAVNEGFLRTWYDSTRYAAVSAFLYSGTNLFAATNGGVCVSTNNGTNWSGVNNGLYSNRPGPGPTCLALNGGNLFVGTIGYIKGGGAIGVLLSTNSGANWSPVNDGLPRPVWHPDEYLYIFSLASTAQYLVAGTDDGIWRRAISEMITSVSTKSRGTADEFRLEQNYPNPFNPSTTIRYQLPKSAIVRLSVYDILGREVSVLLNERKNAGTYEVTFDAAGLSSGVYLYRLQAGEFTQTKRLLLLR